MKQQGQNAEILPGSEGKFQNVKSGAIKLQNMNEAPGWTTHRGDVAIRGPGTVGNATDGADDVRGKSRRMVQGRGTATLVYHINAGVREQNSGNGFESAAEG